MVNGNLSSLWLIWIWPLSDPVSCLILKRFSSEICYLGEYDWLNYPTLISVLWLSLYWFLYGWWHKYCPEHYAYFLKMIKSPYISCILEILLQLILHLKSIHEEKLLWVVCCQFWLENWFKHVIRCFRTWVRPSSTLKASIEVTVSLPFIRTILVISL